MKQKLTIFLSGLLILFLCTVIINSKIASTEKNEYLTLFQLSLDDLDFDNEITGGFDESYTPVAFSYDMASGTPRNLVRSWGILRVKDNKTPQADPGTPELLKKYNSIYIADVNKPVIYLTFDEGYENGYTDDILDCLSRQKVKALFFITGPYLNQHEHLVRRMVEEGHEVGNHTVGHFSLPTLDDEKMKKEITDLDKLFYEKFKKHMVFLRPPKGEYSERSLEISSKLGYINVFWSFAYDDWYRDKQRGWDYAYNKVMSNLHNGAILLLHAVSSDNAQALERIIVDARKKGYEFGDVLDLIDIARGENR
ncbi:MAG: polysaccharide deacetylase family protein [Clostridiaceae bacterium]|jgi:peptidoglycan-N-acetylmuramic acid deacetylase|nr:polysaccharide deacetylase family protein [Clostridiaceae bacterium]